MNYRFGILYLAVNNGNRTDCFIIGQHNAIGI